MEDMLIEMSLGSNFISVRVNIYFWRKWSREPAGRIRRAAQPWKQRCFCVWVLPILLLLHTHKFKIPNFGFSRKNACKYYLNSGLWYTSHFHNQKVRWLSE